MVFSAIWTKFGKLYSELASKYLYIKKMYSDFSENRFLPVFQKLFIIEQFDQCKFIDKVNCTAIIFIILWNPGKDLCMDGK